MMLKDVPKKTMYLANPLDSTSRFKGGRLMDNNPPLNLGCEHMCTPRRVYDQSTVLPETAITKVQWTKFLKALIYIMPDDTTEDMREYAMAKPARKKGLE
eukprot:9221726-Karenia_brevis.AAC.1